MTKLEVTVHGVPEVTSRLHGFRGRVDAAVREAVANMAKSVMAENRRQLRRQSVYYWLGRMPRR